MFAGSPAGFVAAADADVSSGSARAAAAETGGQNDGESHDLRRAWRFTCKSFRNKTASLKLQEVQWRREAAGSLLSPSPTTLPAAVR